MYNAWVQFEISQPGGFVWVIVSPPSLLGRGCCWLQRQHYYVQTISQHSPRKVLTNICNFISFDSFTHLSECWHDTHQVREGGVGVCKRCRPNQIKFLFPQILQIVKSNIKCEMNSVCVCVCKTYTCKAKKTTKKYLRVAVGGSIPVPYFLVILICIMLVLISVTMWNNVTFFNYIKLLLVARIK